MSMNTTHPEATLWQRLAGLLRRTPLPATAQALRWRGRDRRPDFEIIHAPSPIELDDLQCIERQKAALDRNTRQFMRGLPCNNALLWGPRGTGKSSLIKALFNAHATAGLGLIEVAPAHLDELHEIAARIGRGPRRFIIFCDDLSFERDDGKLKALKAALDGSARSLPDNLVIYATSNRRHLVPEFMQENLQSSIEEGELRMSEALEEKLSLSERFGLCLAFHSFNQEQYLSIVNHWLGRFGAPPADPVEVENAALQWALERGTRSGRSASQFARDWAGRRQLGDA